MTFHSHAALCFGKISEVVFIKGAAEGGEASAFLRTQCVIEVVEAVRIVDYRLKGEDVGRMRATIVVLVLSTSSADHPQS